MSNIAKIQAQLRARALEALLLTDETDMLYATGFYTEGAVLITPDRAFLVTDSRYIEAARAKVTDAEVIMSTATDRRSDILKRLLRQCGVGLLAVEEARLSYREYQSLGRLLETEFTAGQAVTETLRQVKEPWEVQSIVSAQRIAERALSEVLGLIKPGMSEKQLAAELEYRMALAGGEGLAFDTIAITGAKTSMPHGVPGQGKIAVGDFITMDFGCKINGYCSDMTRTVALGSVTDEMRRVYDIVLEAQLAGIETFKAGVAGKRVDAAARRVIEKAGYGDCFGHGFGHSVGLHIHEDPNASPRSEEPLPAGAVVTAEPGIYLPGRFGVRIEDMVLVTGEGCENLTKAPKELIIL